MLISLALGTAIICLTVCVHVVGLMVITVVASKLSARYKLHRRPHRVAVMLGMVLGLFSVVSVEIWLWAMCFMALRAAPDFEAALYLSTITFSTVGYGDIVPVGDWRLLAALEGITGFLMIGWSTAYLVTAGTKFGPFRTGEHF